MKKFDKPIIVLRKKIEGENSIEELAYRLSKKLTIDVVTMPYHSLNIYNILRNIIFMKKIEAPIYYIISPTEAYLLPFLKHKGIITYHDLGTIYKSRNVFYKVLKKILLIYPSKYYAKKITFVSDQTKNEYITSVKIKNKEKLQVIYNSYNPKFDSKNEKQSNSLYTILHVGTADRKNLNNVIKACYGLRIKLIIVGKLSNEQKDLLSRGKIDFINSFDIDIDTLVSLYKNADVITFPSSYEGFGMPIIEANVIGTPIIAGDIPVLHEVANDAAYFVDGKECSQIRKAIIDLMNNKEINNKLIQNGYSNAKRFSEDNIYKQYKLLLGL